MTTPTGPIKLSDVQTEFGGANPISMSEYYRGGTYVNSGTVTSATDGTAISTSGTIRLGMFRGVQAAHVVSSWTLSPHNTKAGATTTLTATLTLNTDGTITYSSSSTGTGSTTVANPGWYTPAVTGIGSSYWVKATGTGLTGTTGTWLQLSSARSWSLSSPSTSDLTAFLTLQFAATSGGTVIGTGTANFEAGNTSI